MKQRRNSGFFLYNSNKLEKLLDKAIEIIDKMPFINPLAKTNIVVQSDGMGRWFTLEMAKRKGVCANLTDFTMEKYLGKFASEVLKIDYGEKFNSENLKWTIYDILSNAPRSRYRELNAYISGDPLKRFFISAKCADLFDQYSVYRHGMLLSWKQGELLRRDDRDEVWQRELFLEAAGKLTQLNDRSGFLEDFVKKCGEVEEIPEEYKNGVILFGISTMSEYHLLMFKALSGLVPVHLFFMNPCMEHWGDIVTTRKSEMFRMLEQDELYYESPNRFLADLGISGRIFFLSLYENDDDIIVDEDLFENPEETGLSMLQTIQKEILEMNENEKIEVDDSIRINGCWGRTREMEVLKDELLDIFDKNPDIMPHDVVVITPDIEEYAPYIEAVFGSEGDPVIPFSIADRSAGNDGRTVDAFLKLLKLLDSDFLKTDVLSLFENECICEKFDMTRSDLEIVRTAVEESGIKWGIDKRSRELKGFPPFEQNTWKFGFDRMILGYSMPGNGTETFGGVMPYDEIEGGSARTIARFMSFCDTLFKAWISFGMDRSPADWAARLNTLVDDVFSDDANFANDLIFLRKIFDALVREEKLSGMKCAIPFRVVKALLEENLALNGFNRGFLNGGVTFCSIKPLRSIPFKVVCLSGMNDDLFPRDPKSTGFDLIRKYPSPKDRNAKNSDRYFFLESLLSARKYFILSYSARNVRDSSYNISSSPVRLLIDYLAEKTRKNDGKDCFKETLHPLQPFSGKYFSTDSPLSTFSQKDYKAYISFSDSELPETLKITTLESRLGENFLNPGIDEFISFFMNPPRYFLTKRMGVTVPYPEKEDTDSEIFSIDSLTAYLYRNEYLDMHLKGLKASDFRRKMKGTGKSPHGPAGQVLLETIINEMTPFLSKVDGYRSGSLPEPVSFTLPIEMETGKVVISGKLDSIYQCGQLFFKPAKGFNQKELVRWWIKHLIMNALNINKNTYFTGMDSDIGIVPVTDPQKYLKDIAEVYIKGLSQPLPVTPYIIEAMASELGRGETAENVFAKMLEKKASPWGGSSDDFAFRYAADITGFYAGGSKVIELVADVSDRVFGAFKRHREDFR